MGKENTLAMKIIVAGRLGPNLGGHRIGLVFSLNPNGLLQIKVPRNRPVRAPRSYPVVVIGSKIALFSTIFKKTLVVVRSLRGGGGGGGGGEGEV